MSNTITAIYQTSTVADLVRTRLADLGISDRYIHMVHGADREDEIDTLHLPSDEAAIYKQAVRQGHSIVSADVDEGYIDEAAEAMRHPEEGVDIDAYETEYRDAPASAETAEGAYAADHASAAGATGETETIAVGEERLTLGKRVSERGSAHVRTYVQEIPVEERIRLREERLTVERRPVDRVVTGAEADALFQDRDVEVTTRSEEAVIGKETVVTEEVVIGKEVTEREEVVEDTIRKTEVEIEGERT